MRPVAKVPRLVAWSSGPETAVRGGLGPDEEVAWIADGTSTGLAIAGLHEELVSVLAVRRHPLQFAVGDQLVDLRSALVPPHGDSSSLTRGRSLMCRMNESAESGASQYSELTPLMFTSRPRRSSALRAAS